MDIYKEINRSAHASLLGYFYQFDKTILAILSAQDQGVITIEGIEDIDIGNIGKTTLIQCKYLQAKKFSLSQIRKPVVSMLGNFLNGGDRFFYYLYIHFGGGSEVNIDLSVLKTILTYTEKGKKHVYYTENKISDKQLSLFLKKFKYVSGENFDTQHRVVIQTISNNLRCDTKEAEVFYYCKALQIIFDHATKNNPLDRRITKLQLIENLQRDNLYLFNKWFSILKSEKDYSRFIKNKIKSCGGLHTTKNKLLFLDNVLLKPTVHGLNFIQFVKELLLKHYNLNKHLQNAKPWTLILDIDRRNSLLRIKKQLITNNIVFNDGFEHLEFSSHIFNSPPVINCDRSDKISKSSYLLKILSKDTYLKNRTKITCPDIVFFCSAQSSDKLFAPDICTFQIEAKNLEGVASLI